MKCRHRGDSLRNQLDRLLTRLDLHFQGIALRCRRCDETAYAATVELAETFGWSALRHVKGPNYTGLCVHHGKKPKA
jgi:hypothetical protein